MTLGLKTIAKKSSYIRITKHSKLTAPCRLKQLPILIEFNNIPHTILHRLRSLIRRFIGNSLVLSKLTSLCQNKRICISKYYNFKDLQGLLKIMLMLDLTHKYLLHTSKQMMAGVSSPIPTQRWIMKTFLSNR
jgi:hypothetical protein